jgi:Ca2+/Na+ antiporter
MMILDFALVVLGIVAGLIAISTTVRLINGESWATANKFRTSKRVIVLLGYFALAVLFALFGDMGFGVLILLLAPAVLYMIRTSTPESRSKPPATHDAP